MNTLHRYPHLPQETRQAWDAADELMLDHAESLSLEGRRILILNDSFGALTRGLLEHAPTSYTDSYLSAHAIEINCQGVSPAPRLCHDLAELAGPYDLVLARVPKNLSFFEDELARVAQHLAPGAQLVCGYMIKHHAKASFELIEKYAGQVTTSLARKKARLIFASFTQPVQTSPYPLRLEIEGFERAFFNHSNVFSRERLDIGTRFLLDHIPDQATGTVLDLGCGNGILGISAKLRNPHAEIIFSDESWMALQSARLNYANHFGEGGRFEWNHALEGQPSESVDLVICNPPFHHGHAIGGETASAMFRDARRVLRKGGRLRVIGNSHLLYPQALKRLFGNSHVVATNAKFVIVDAGKEART